MARWHGLSCPQPSFVVSAGIPHCTTCDTSPELNSIQPKSSPLPPIPPDEPYAQKNLWWPKTVKFTGPVREEDEFGKRFLDIETTPGPANVRSKQDASLGDKIQNVGSRVPSIYGPTLGRDEFRLIYLKSSESEDDPVHLSLETYSHDNCPEYETVSYTWANEKNSSELCKPIYIDHNWDVLFQTENCWEMLKFMRPRRGSRMIWVDAICINQGNLSERGAQVEKMGKIYSECLRVVVYLGKGNITAMSPQHHPRRKMLGDDSAQPSFSATENTLSDVLKSRYFSRVWVIQELILARRVSMRVGDVEFWADPTTWSGRSGSHSPWDYIAPRWLKHTAQGGLPEMIRVDSLIPLTSHAKASDPRDKIFGLLGLLPGNELSADYTLSCQHVFIGIFAFYLQRLTTRACCIMLLDPADHQNILRGCRTGHLITRGLHYSSHPRLSWETPSRRMAAGETVI